MFKNEKDYIEEIVAMLDNEIVRSRVTYLLKWYSKKATWNKIKYFICAFLGIMIPALITLVNGICEDSSPWISVLSTSGTLVAGLLAITRWQEGWLRYRQTIEIIKSKISIYLVERNYKICSDNIDKEKTIDMDVEFIKLIEEIVANENEEWLSIRKSDMKHEIEVEKSNSSH